MLLSSVDSVVVRYCVSCVVRIAADNVGVGCFWSCHEGVVSVDVRSGYCYCQV